MKRFILSVTLIVLGGHVIAQDIITKKDATEILAKVVKIGTTEIEYKRWNNLDGPMYTLPVDEVFIIKYENGQRDVFSTIEDRNGGSRNKTVNNTYRPHYEGEVSAGYALGLDLVGELDYISVQTVHGVRIIPYLFVGVGTGLFFYHLCDNMMILPVFTNIKGSYPISNKLSISMSADLGAAIGIYYIDGGHFYTSIGPGIQFGRNQAFEFSLRYQYMGLNALMARIGFRF